MATQTERATAEAEVCDKANPLPRKEMRETRQAETAGDTGNSERPLTILAIHEMLPHPDRHGADVQWMQMLCELRAQGHKGGSRRP